jgi:hypothetical protein
VRLFFSHWGVNLNQKEYKYYGDPVFVVSIICYSINKLLLISHRSFESSFMNNYFNDIFVVPCLLPILIYCIARMKLRNKYSGPLIIEIFLFVSVISLMCEIFGPYFLGKGVYDPIDIFAYLLGGMISWFIWRYGKVSYKFS